MQVARINELHEAPISLLSDDLSPPRWLSLRPPPSLFQNGDLVAFQGDLEPYTSVQLVACREFAAQGELAHASRG